MIQLLTFSIHACDNMDLISAIACTEQKWFTLLLFLLISDMLVLVYFYFYYIAIGVGGILNRHILRQHNISISPKIARQYDFGKILVESGFEKG